MDWSTSGSGWTGIEDNWGVRLWDGGDQERLRGLEWSQQAAQLLNRREAIRQHRSVGMKLHVLFLLSGWLACKSIPIGFLQGGGSFANLQLGIE